MKTRVFNGILQRLHRYAKSLPFVVNMWSSKAMSRRIFLGWVGASIQVTPIFYITRTARSQTMVESPEMRGKSFRLALEEAYETLATQQKIKAGLPGFSVSDLALQFIPLNSSFDEAELVLQFAGFRVNPRPDRNISVNRSAVSAVIADFAKIAFGRISAYAYLKPFEPGDYRYIESINVNFVKSML